jgi:hypothetical protein
MLCLFDDNKALYRVLHPNEKLAAFAIHGVTVHAVEVAVRIGRDMISNEI